MFKKSVVYTLNENIREIHSNLLEAAETIALYKFTECTAIQKKTMGFSKTPLGGYVDEVNGGIYLCVTTQTKSANKHEVNSVIARKIENWKETLLSQQEASVSEDLEPSKRLLKEFKEEAEVEVLQHTFPNSPSTVAVMFRKNGQVVVEGNYTSAEQVLGLLRKVLGSLPCIPHETEKPISDLLDGFLSEEVNDTVCLGDKATFITPEDRKIILKGESLYDSQAQDFIKQGIMAESVEIVRDGMISTMLRADGMYDAIKFSKDLTCEYEEGDNGGTFLVEARELCNLIDDINERLTEGE